MKDFQHTIFALISLGYHYMCVDAGTAVAAFDGNITFRLDLEGGDAGATTNLEVRHTLTRRLFTSTPHSGVPRSRASQ